MVLTIVRDNARDGTRDARMYTYDNGLTLRERQGFAHGRPGEP
jgi:hypothetical protein